MVINIPPKIKFLSHEYEVLFDSAQEDREFRGTFSDRSHKIFLNPELHPQQLRVTFLHEVLHMFFMAEDMKPPESDVSRLAEDLGEFLFGSLGLDFNFSEVKTLKRRVDSDS